MQVAQYIRMRTTTQLPVVVKEAPWPSGAVSRSDLRRLAVRGDGDRLEWSAEAEAVRVLDDHGEEIARYSYFDYQDEVAALFAQRNKDRLERRSKDKPDAD